MPPPPPSPAPKLLECWLEIVRPWRVVFAQQRTFLRAVRQALGSLLCIGSLHAVAYHLDHWT